MEVLDPTAEEAVTIVAMAPTPADLTSLSVGLLDNSKVGTTRLYDFVEELLLADHGVGSVLRRRKGNMSAPADERVMSELAACELVLSGVGD